MDKFILIVIAGFGIHELFRRLPIQFSFAFFGVFPILLTIPWLISQGEHDWMTWGKIYAVLVAANILTLARKRYEKNNNVLFVLMYWATIFNIFFPITRIIFIQNKIIAALIACSAGFLILTLPDTRSMKVNKDSFHDFDWDVPYFWLISYTIWNWSVVYLLFPDCGGNAIAMLLAPLLVAFINRKLYAQARAYSLGFYLIMWFTVPSMTSMLLTPDWENITVQWISAAAAFLFGLVHAICVYIKYRRDLL